MEFQLKKNQQQIHDIILSTNDNYLVHGKPGTGKSVLIRALTEANRKPFTLAAPTGLAALNINGRTLHSIFRLPTSQGIIQPNFNNFPNDCKVIDRIANIDHLIIDEISMVRADAFDYIDRLMRFAKGSNLPFGGCQLIIIGDFYQLPPVVIRQEVPQLRDAGYSSAFVFSSKAFQGNFKVLLLHEVLRQKGDPDFVELLNNARDGSVMPAQCKLLNKQVGVPNDIRIKLAGTNKQADEINQQELARLPDELHTFNADSYGEWPAYPAEQELKLKIGAQVMVKMNGADRSPDDTRAGFKSQVVNGTLGVIESVPELGEDGIQRVRIRKEDGKVVTIYRQHWERKIKIQNGDEWTEKVVAAYEQVPLALAWAISIHKSQGQSFDKVHLDLSKVFAPGQAYVALSRCRSLAGISLEAAIATKVFWANRDVVDFFEDIEQEA